MNRAEYAEYLRTPHWHTLKRIRQELDGGHCMICRNTVQLQCHHNCYDRMPYMERIDDVLTICNECHEIFVAMGKLKEGP